VVRPSESKRIDPKISPVPVPISLPVVPFIRHIRDGILMDKIAWHLMEAARAIEAEALPGLTVAARQKE